MKSRFTLLLFMILMLIMSSGCAMLTGVSQQQVKYLYDIFGDGMKNGDVEVASYALSPDAVIQWADNSTSTTSQFKQAFDIYFNWGLKFNTFEFSDVRILSNSDIPTASANVTISGTGGGVDYKADGFVTVELAQENGEWKFSKMMFNTSGFFPTSGKSLSDNQGNLEWTKLLGIK